ncbi:MBOAT family O-acyltransferase [Tamlana sp. 2_MG-2023]|uniref:MBOAT family O-acyltransferase n=1 Tax=unclassified Tamlana TaxID=2614803 RepID=UPI0026E12075|nr:MULTISPECIES: MBOAT family O-acyltransferase [unclassified Tamlana]MDO6758761.1 MBOAT family O-acyltransferase [Tamlana sp. 2_MG-2023]MDO6789460.1 MBOAT family O-acyltransferase [Tamlana sp. 1_MG-2023]
MFFNSFTFLLFFSVVFFVYWFPLKRNINKQNIFLLLASYVFYGWWDWRFLTLIAFSTVVDFYCGKYLGAEKKQAKRKLILGISLVVNLGLLGFFKYYNFFIESWVELWSEMGVHVNLYSVKIILPVGISFYTFQTMSYTIDVYRNKIEPTHSFINFAAFVSFFPQLVAGPIERASHLLPQFSKKRVFDYNTAVSGSHLIVWGLFKKIVIADTCATYVNVIFDDYHNMNSLSLLLGAVYFSFQIYGDFSGYSDIAIGVSRLLGFDLKQNFNYPYFSRNIAEFWRKWHISLSTWFRDYLYIPLGGSRGSLALTIRNVFIIFAVSGFWHGANWTFVFWGFLHALYFLPLLLFNKNREYLDTVSLSLNKNGLIQGVNIIFTFLLVALAWVFFRANTINDAFAYLEHLVTNQIFTIQYLSIERYAVEALLLLSSFVFAEWFSKKRETPFFGKLCSFNLGLTILAIIVLGVYSTHSDFIYFQF